MAGTYWIAVALQVATSAAQLAPGETLLEVSATGETTGVPDVATFSSGVTANGNTAQSALAANSAIAERLVTAARSAGVPPEAIRTQGISVGPRFRPDKDGDDTDEIVGYRASNQLRFRITDVALAPRVIDALFKAGANGLDGPTFEFADDAPLARAARADAVRKAQAQAADYARALGMRVGRVMRISERSARRDDAGDIIVTAGRLASPAPPVAPGAQSVTVTVWIDFALTQ